MSSLSKNSTRPWIALNMAMTADGKTSGPQTEPKVSTPLSEGGSMSSFGSRRDQLRLFKIRASMDAVMCGRKTIESAAIDMGPGLPRFCRWRKARGMEEYNRRIVVSASGELNPASRVFELDFSPILIATTRRGKSRCLPLFKERSWIKVMSFGEKEIDLQKLMIWLHHRWGIQRMVLEGGGRLNDSMFRSHLVDEIFLTICPLIYGGNSHSTICDGLGFQNLQSADSFQCIERCFAKGEAFLRFQRVQGNPDHPRHAEALDT